MTRAGWIGTGAMGARMATRLLRAGHEVAVWNRTRSRAEALAGAGARVTGSPADAARDAEFVFVMVTDPDALAAVTDGPDGLATGVAAGTTVVDASTAGPAAVARLRAALPGTAGLLDAPVLGSLAEAEAGTLTVLAGGPPEVFARSRPLLSQFGEPVHVGGSGQGAAAKLVANFALLASVCSLGESLALADSLGLARADAWRVLAFTPLAAQAERRRRAVESGAYPPRFTLATAGKDAGLIAGAAAGAALRLPHAVQAWFTDAAGAGLGGQDYTAVLSHILAAGRTGSSEGGPGGRPGRPA